MKYAALLVYLGFIGPVFAECNDSKELVIPAARIPDLPRSGNKMEDFIPAGWKLAEVVKDDFNRDKTDDIALAIVENNPGNILNNECGLGEEEVNTNPYALIVALQEKNAGFKLAASDFAIIPRLENPVFDQPYSGISSSKGVLSVSYHFWQSAGSWSTSDHTYKFRFQDNCMRLIGHEYHWLHRASGEENTTSTNFITGAYIISHKNADNKRLLRKKFILKNNPVYCLGKVPKEFDHIKY